MTYETPPDVVRAIADLIRSVDAALRPDAELMRFGLLEAITEHLAAAEADRVQQLHVDARLDDLRLDNG